MLRYNICFIRQDNRWLLLNRDFPSWMGCWNGVGGKLEPDEAPRDSMIREIAEETGLPAAAYVLTYKGVVSWTSNQGQFGGMYLYAATLSDDVAYATPRKTDEGILDWKLREWIMHPENRGVSSNIPLIMKHLEEATIYHHHCQYSGNKLMETRTDTIGPETEDLWMMKAYLSHYMEQHRLSQHQPVGRQ